MAYAEIQLGICLSGSFETLSKVTEQDTVHPGTVFDAVLGSARVSTFQASGSNLI